MTDGPHCDDIPPQDKLKHFAYECPRHEGNSGDRREGLHTRGGTGGNDLHACSAIAFSNRYDLRSPPKDAGAGRVKYPDCGGYRVIFALNTGRTTPPALASDGKLH